LCRTRVGVDDLVGNLNETGSLGPILQVFDNIAFFTGDCLPREAALSYRAIAKEKIGDLPGALEQLQRGTR
jgi:hypothetical protein